MHICKVSSSHSFSQLTVSPLMHFQGNKCSEVVCHCLSQHSNPGLPSKYEPEPTLNSRPTSTIQIRIVSIFKMECRVRGQQYWCFSLVHSCMAKQKQSALELPENSLIPCVQLSCYHLPLSVWEWPTEICERKRPASLLLTFQPLYLSPCKSIVRGDSRKLLWFKEYSRKQNPFSALLLDQPKHQTPACKLLRISTLLFLKRVREKTGEVLMSWSWGYLSAFVMESQADGGDLGMLSGAGLVERC